MNSAATVPSDIPIKLVAEFSVKITFPLAHIINFCIQNGVYPYIWKIESVTPVPKFFPTEKLKDLRKLFELLKGGRNCMISNAAQLQCTVWIIFLLATQMSVLLCQPMGKQTEAVLSAVLR